MAQIVKLRRSAVSGQKPTNSNLQLGELAINTTDGKVFFAVSGSLGPSVEELVSTNTVNTGSINVSGSINLIGNQNVTGSVIANSFVGDGSQITNIGLTEKVFYVSEDGSDLNDGKTLSTSFRTIKAAVDAATINVNLNPGFPSYRQSIQVKSGYYVEEAPITVPPSTSILGDDLRSVVIRPTSGTTTENLFLLNNGCYMWGLRLEGCVIDNLEDPRQGFFFAFAPGAYIVTSPYIQNCSEISTQADKVYTPLDYTTGNPLIGNGPGGLIVDDSVLDGYSPLKSMIVDAYTQVAFNGIGICVRGRGYAQLVSFFTNFSRVGTYCIDGGHASLLNSNTTFGDYGLRSKGLRILVNPDTSLVTGTTIDVNASLLIKNRKTDIQTYMINQLSINGNYSSSYSNTGSTIYTSTIKDSGLLIDAICDDLLSPSVTRVVQFASGLFVGQDTSVGEVQTLPVQSGFTQGAIAAFPLTGSSGNIAEDFVLAYQYIREYIVDDPDNYFSIVSGATQTKVSQLIDVVEDTVQRVIVDEAGADLLEEFGSLITSTSHDFSYAGAGVNFLALPKNQGGVGLTNTELRVVEESGGRVFHTSGDETGDFFAGQDFVIRQATGTIEGRTFYKAISSVITPINLALESNF